MHNLGCVRAACAALDVAWPFTLEDIYYGSPLLGPALLTWLAHLFDRLEHTPASAHLTCIMEVPVFLAASDGRPASTTAREVCLWACGCSFFPGLHHQHQTNAVPNPPPTAPAVAEIGADKFACVVEWRAWCH